MADLSTLARPYARAAFDYAKEQHAVDEWQNYLSGLTTIVNDKQVNDYLYNPAISSDTKVATLIDLYQHTQDDGNNVFKTLSTAIEGAQPVVSQAQSVVSTAFSNFLSQLAQQNRLPLLPSIADRFDLLKAADAKEVHAYVTSAYPLTKAQELLVENRLSTAVKANVVLHIDVDPSLIAGVMIKIGDKVIDDSVRGKLKQLRTQLTA